MRVEATLSASLSSVANSSTDGKEEKSSGFCAFIAAIRTETDSAMLSTKKRSSRIAGIGITINRMMVRIPKGSASPGLKKVRALTARTP